MFADLVGSTALSARLDPEDLRKVIAAYHKWPGGGRDYDGRQSLARSNSANAPVTRNISFPEGVVVSIACWSRYRSSFGFASATSSLHCYAISPAGLDAEPVG